MICLNPPPVDATAATLVSVSSSVHVLSCFPLIKAVAGDPVLYGDNTNTAVVNTRTISAQWSSDPYLQIYCPWQHPSVAQITRCYIHYGTSKKLYTREEVATHGCGLSA